MSAKQDPSCGMIEVEIVKFLTTLLEKCGVLKSPQNSTNELRDRRVPVGLGSRYALDDGDD